MNAEFDIVDPTATPPSPIIKVVAKKTHFSDANLLMKLLLEYDLKSKIKQQ